jgi:hypothetical protein
LRRRHPDAVGRLVTDGGVVPPAPPSPAQQPTRSRSADPVLQMLLDVFTAIARALAAELAAARA